MSSTLIAGDVATDWELPPPSPSKMSQEDRERFAVYALKNQTSHSGLFLDSRESHANNGGRHHATSSSISVEGRKKPFGTGKTVPTGTGRSSKDINDVEGKTSPARHRSSFSTHGHVVPRRSFSPISLRSARPSYNLQAKTLSGRLSRYYKRRTMTEIVIQLVFLMSVAIFGSALLGQGYDGSRTSVVLPLIQPERKQLLERFPKASNTFRALKQQEESPGYVEDIYRVADISIDKEVRQPPALVIEPDDEDLKNSVPEFIQAKIEQSEQHQGALEAIESKPGQPNLHPLEEDMRGYTTPDTEVAELEGGEPNYFEQNLAMKQKQQPGQAQLEDPPPISDQQEGRSADNDKDEEAVIDSGEEFGEKSTYSTLTSLYSFFQFSQNIINNDLENFWEIV